MLIEHVLSHFTKFVKTRFLAQKSGSQLRCRKMLKMPWNIQKTPPMHVKRLLKNILKTLFSAQKSSSQLRCRTMLKKKPLWNTQKTPTKHVLRLFIFFWKSGSRLKNPVLGSVRTMLNNTLKHPENTNKTCFESFWEILENLVLGSKMWFSAQISSYAKIPWNTQKIPTEHVLGLFKKFLKIRFSAKKSGSRPRCRTMLKKYFETLRKHQLNTFWGILRNF